MFKATFAGYSLWEHFICWFVIGATAWITFRGVWKDYEEHPYSLKRKDVIFSSRFREALSAVYTSPVVLLTVIPYLIFVIAGLFGVVFDFE